MICGGGGGGGGGWGGLHTNSFAMIMFLHFFKYKTAFLAIQFICDRRIQRGAKHIGNSVFYMR